MRYLLCLLFPISLCAQQSDPFFTQLIPESDTFFSKIFSQPEKFQVQIIYTQIDRDENNNPSFTSYIHSIKPDEYFYPASTVKMPTALLALEKLNELKIIGLDRNTPMTTWVSWPPQSARYRDSTARTGFPSVGHDVKKIFIASDNDSYNRLYEFLGQAYINDKLHQKGFTNSRIIHRLSAPGFDTLENRYTNPVVFSHENNMLYMEGTKYSHHESTLRLEGEKRGVGYENSEGELVEEAFDFSHKNYVSLANLHDQLKALIFPNSVPAHQRFNINEADRQFVLSCMSTRPSQSRFPNYDYPDNYCKFFMYGDIESAIPSSIKIFNKVGWAYGYLTDVAYFVDHSEGIEFLIAASIHVNENQIYNDGNYEYETIGLPFFGKLGRYIYDYEHIQRARKRKNKPDLSEFDLAPVKY